MTVPVQAIELKNSVVVGNSDGDGCGLGSAGQ